MTGMEDWNIWINGIRSGRMEWRKWNGLETWMEINGMEWTNKD